MHISNKQLVTKTETIWALDVVMSKYSFNSSSNKKDLFTTQFPDSGMSKNFSYGKTKCWFIVKCRIAPCFVQLLNSQLKDLEYFVVLFDESFNCVAKKKKKKQKKKKKKKKKKQQTNGTCIFDFWILTLWLPGTIVQNFLVSHLQIIHAPISNSVLVH